MEKNIEFDTVIDRKDTNCLKYDFSKERGYPEQILPLWVADMDFKVSSYITEAICKRVEHGIFGYSEVKKDEESSYFQALQQWMLTRHDWKVERDWLIKTPGVVFAMAMAVQAFTKPGDSVMIQNPVYYPFSEVIQDNHRKIVDNTLYIGEDGKYHMDFADFEQKITTYGVRLFLLCNPHNPVGRVWTKEELEIIGAICLKHKVIVVSDEIHEDFVYEGAKHQVFAGISDALRDIAITCTSPSKTFNLAGLQISNIFIANPKLRYKFKKQIDAAGYSQLNALGLTACEAAYRYGGEWYEALLTYLQENIEFTQKYLREHLPHIQMVKPEGTYLIWLDFRKLGLSEEELEDLVVNRAGLWLDRGSIFGTSGAGFERINIACPRATLERALSQLETAVKHVVPRFRVEETA